MKSKLLIAVAAFSLSIASAKTYEITVDNVSKAGDVELQPGKYSVRVENSKVRFTNESTGKAYECDAKIVNSDKKFEATQMDIKDINGSRQIAEIDLGGTKTRVQFQ